MEWWRRRGKSDDPSIFEGVTSASDAGKRAELASHDRRLRAGSPAFLHILQEMVAAADFTLIPVKPSVVDVLATAEAVVLAIDAGATHLSVFNNVGNDVGAQERMVDAAREALFGVCCVGGFPLARYCGGFQC